LQQSGGDISGLAVAKDMFSVIVLIFVGEMLADCVKHAFITKFNEIPASAYIKVGRSLP
jgi:hypothetical protein